MQTGSRHSIYESNCDELGKRVPTNLKCAIVCTAMPIVFRLKRFTPAGTSHSRRRSKDARVQDIAALQPIANLLQTYF